MRFRPMHRVAAGIATTVLAAGAVVAGAGTAGAATTAHQASATRSVTVQTRAYEPGPWHHRHHRWDDCYCDDYEYAYWNYGDYGYGYGGYRGGLLGLSLVL
ncbi:hypothetical protein [Streptantibioticus cattleyicolor]|uniref:Uncharacterized protein n=1 Tax=Streptantibioticus cattleyicolor (strain ATCC 35852 / DSM 46488 / JCM 4925 / NBRC 14057 / NRRL 8057) TaxID=1003195 RepID=F8JJK4_STREN|nr:hypothetical protein [Streptantibioticus cattleyicolor]AEW98661.1 hypothetical protein SCATT_p04680 [Streptantibioticus cattleyicolor NRRL 8057 = DSM 46488]CCB72281.1 exported protein of unknown function [Streptantibioticus cattleyicolor NRRL 8057 = DSM 46488]